MKSRLCSPECKRKDERIKAKERELKMFVSENLICRECNKEFNTEYTAKNRAYCSSYCGKRNARRTAKALRRARIRGNKYESINPIEIFKRDNWKCQLCGIKTPYKYRGTIRDDAPEMDHIKPLALGGSHTKENVQCLCRKCNQKKGATSEEQLVMGI